MQIGTRWPVGASAPTSLADEVRAALAKAEPDLAPDEYWTLTWLEGRPTVTSDSGYVIRVAATGSVVSVPPGAMASDDDDEAWLGE